MPLPRNSGSNRKPLPRVAINRKAPINRNQVNQARPVEQYHQPNNSGANAPQFPGEQKGNTREETSAFIRDQVRRKGFVVTGGTTAQDFKLELSGTARFFYGLTFENKIGTITLTINNEVVFENVSARFLQFGLTNQDYYAVNRPLSGQDSITLTIIGFASYTAEQLEVVYK